MSNKQFHSKVDRWLGVLLILLPIAPVVSTVMLWTTKGMSHGLVGAASILFIGAIYGGLLYPLYYEIEDQTLLIRFGLIRVRVPYKDILSAKPSSNILSSPALSLDRLHIEIQGRSFGVLISPKDKAGFLQALAGRCPHLSLEGLELQSKKA